MHVHATGLDLIRKLHPARGPALGSTVAALFYRLIKYLEYETVQNNDEEGVQAVAPKEVDPKIETGEETVKPKDAVPVEVTGFGGGLLQSQDAQPEAMARAGPLADPRDLSDKMDRLENMVSSILAQLKAAQQDRLSGSTIIHTEPMEKVGTPAPSSPASASSGHQLPTNTLADHPAYDRV